MKTLSKFIVPILLLCLLCPLMLIAVGAEGEADIGINEDTAAEIKLGGAESNDGAGEADDTGSSGITDNTGSDGAYNTDGTESEADKVGSSDIPDNTGSSDIPDNTGSSDGAYNTDDTESEADNAGSSDITDNTGSSESIGEPDGAHTDASEPSSTEDDANTEDGTEGASFFDELYAAVIEHSAEIASAIAAISSIILAFCMRRGLTPMLKDALTGIAGAVGKLREGVDASEKNSEKITSALTERLAAAESTVEKLTATVNAITERSAAEKEEQLMREDILTVMSAEVEMLYDIFMSSALPQYKKDAVGERVSAMRKQLGYREVAEDEA